MPAVHSVKSMTEMNLPSMRVAVLGMGPIALGSAALLLSRGHVPVLWSPNTVEAAPLKLHAAGALEISATVNVAATCASAVASADAVLVAVPATAYRAVLDQLAASLQPGQPVLISGHLSFGALYLAKLLAERLISVPIVAWGTTVVSGRRTAPGCVRVSSVRTEIDIATLPLVVAPSALALCETLFGERFRLRSGLLAVALSNVNPQNHLAIALCNFTRIERGETWFQNTNITDSVGRLMEALDAERLAIAEAFGTPVRTLRQHFHLSFHAPEAPLGEMARTLAAGGNDPAAPTSLDTRYVLEDAPFGLYPTALLGRMCGRPAALHEAGLLTLSALYGRDLARENDLVPLLRLTELSVNELRGLTGEGSAP
ncbi:MAG: NAD/NADP octopine/nopaline dehydrogenase family protein [Janthinobacterium lividum]